MEGDYGEEHEDVEPAGADGLRAWAAANASYRTEARIAAMPPGPVAGTVETPFPLDATREEYKRMIRGSGVWARAEDVTPSEVSLASLSAFQRTVNAERVAQYAEEPDRVAAGTRGAHHGLTDHPVVVRKNGKLWLHDGNHRAAAALARGDRTILARVVDLDG